MNLPLSFPGDSVVKNLPAMQEMWVRSLGQEDPLEEGTATHSSILAWRILWTEEPGGLPSMGSQESYMTEATAFTRMEFIHLYLELMGRAETGTNSQVPTFPLVGCTGTRRGTYAGPLCGRLTWESP